jgi:branched-chain amino acid aminotransferase
MIGICKKLGLECAERVLQKHDLYIADEMFLTGTGGEVMPVTKIDGRPIGSGEVGPITKRLKEAFHQRTRE